MGDHRAPAAPPTAALGSPLVRRGSGRSPPRRGACPAAPIRSTGYPIPPWRLDARPHATPQRTTSLFSRAPGAPRGAAHPHLRRRRAFSLTNRASAAGQPADPPRTPLPAYTRGVRRASRGRARTLQALVRLRATSGARSATTGRQPLHPQLSRAPHRCAVARGGRLRGAAPTQPPRARAPATRHLLGGSTLARTPRPTNHQSLFKSTGCAARRRPSPPPTTPRLQPNESRLSGGRPSASHTTPALPQVHSPATRPSSPERPPAAGAC